MKQLQPTWESEHSLSMGKLKTWYFNTYESSNSRKTHRNSLCGPSTGSLIQILSLLKNYEISELWSNISIYQVVGFWIYLIDWACGVIQCCHNLINALRITAFNPGIEWMVPIDRVAHISTATSPFFIAEDFHRNYFLQDLCHQREQAQLSQQILRDDHIDWKAASCNLRCLHSKYESMDTYQLLLL